MGATGVGALLGALTLAFREGVKGLGRWVVWCSAGFGASLIVFALSHNFWVSVILLLPVGYTIMLQMACSNTLIQVMVPDALRGRVMAVYSMMFMGMAPIGALLGGVLADRLGAQTTVAIGGLASVGRAGRPFGCSDHGRHRRPGVGGGRLLVRIATAEDSRGSTALDRRTGGGWRRALGDDNAGGGRLGLCASRVRFRRQASNADSGMALVADVQADEQGGYLFEDTGTLQFSTINGADAGKLGGERTRELSRVGIVAADDDVAIESFVSVEKLSR